MPKHSTWVVKLGGSLIGSPDLPVWLAAIADAGRRRPVVVVPGGGVFADAVRAAQQAMSFDDEIAHDMALQGMRQYGTALAALSESIGAPKLVHLADIEAAAPGNGVWIWDPGDPRLSACALPRDWRVSADSLSLWLSEKFDDSRLVLVKSKAPERPAADVRGLAAEGFVDEYFPALYAAIDRPVWWLERTQAQALSQLLDGMPMRANLIKKSRCPVRPGTGQCSAS